ncbi:hypothetical protein K2173_006455 [Erythroxylum novogranatense]|uniref:Uncharacterized protein n=1 Tax=Erythroxylum novogranatense TaxID=1862640 RepID=A0AAV8TET6_9ROSI|nr:hypothetical protein K2173_006455 [Erythroxylum novogranatense]
MVLGSATTDDGGLPTQVVEEFPAHSREVSQRVKPRDSRDTWEHPEVVDNQNKVDPSFKKEQSTDHITHNLKLAKYASIIDAMQNKTAGVSTEELGFKKIVEVTQQIEIADVVPKQSAMDNFRADNVERLDTDVEHFNSQYLMQCQIDWASMLTPVTTIRQNETSKAGV